jgi:hypothetical protein
MHFFPLASLGRNHRGVATATPTCTSGTIGAVGASLAPTAGDWGKATPAPSGGRDVFFFPPPQLTKPEQPPWREPKTTAPPGTHRWFDG